MSDQLTLFAVDTHASRSQQPGSDGARKTTAISGRSLLALLPKSGHATSLAKTLLDTSAWASTACSLTWRHSATPQGRLLFQLVPRTSRTDEIGSGLWPTVTTSPSRPCEGNVRILRAKVLAGELCEAEATQMLNGKSPMEAQGKIPAMWPTPTARDYKGGRKPETLAASGRGATNSLNDALTVQGQHGALNPQWVEWLMDFPPGWTSLETE